MVQRSDCVIGYVSVYPLLIRRSNRCIRDGQTNEPGFYHRVAPGYPLFDRVILWTRYTPVASGESVYLELRMAEVVPDIPYESHLDPDANDNIKIAKIETSASSDYVAKIDVFTFTDVIVAAEVGQTRTA